MPPIKFIWENGTSNWIVSLIIILLIYAFLLFVLLKTLRRTAPFIILAVSFVLSMLAFMFDLTYAFVLIAAIIVLSLSLVGTSNIGDFNSFIANPFKKIKTKSVNFGVEKIYDSENFYSQVETAVKNLSKSRTGAIMTFERNKSLQNFMKNGVAVNAPFSPELIETIFYEGTRLHDGAVIIHGNQIVAAAVFFNLTTQPFAVKYGSRHRAAIGISEVSDAVTVVVSEETGRISFAVNGQLEPVDSDSFKKILEMYMSESNEENESKDEFE